MKKTTSPLIWKLALILFEKKKKKKATRGTAGLFNHAQNTPHRSTGSGALQCLQPPFYDLSNPKVCSNNKSFKNSAQQDYWGSFYTLLIFAGKAMELRKLGGSEAVAVFAELVFQRNISS